MRTLSLSLIAAALLAVPALQAHAQKIGYVNSTKIFQELPAAKDAQRKIDQLTKPAQDSLEAMQKDLQAQYEDYQKQEALMNDAAKRQNQQKLMDYERRINEYRLAKFGQDGELAQRTEQIVAPIRERIKNAIAAVAREEKYSFVFDKNDQVQVLLYGDPSHDLTYKVIDRLNRSR